MTVTDSELETPMSTTPQLNAVLKGLLPDAAVNKAFVTGNVSMNYGELHEAVARTRGLFARFHLVPGDRIALVTGMDIAVSQLYAACLMSGVVAVVIDPQASASEITVLLAKAKVSAVFADTAVIDRASTLQSDDTVPIVPVAPVGKTKTGFGLLIRKKAPAVSDGSYPGLLVDESPVNERPDFDNDAPAQMLFTSGTTSQPKGVVLSRKNLAAQLLTFESQYGYDANSRVGNHLPLHHTDGINQGPLLAMALGSTWIRPGAVDLQTLGDMLDLLQRERATHLITVPTVIAMFTRLPEVYDDSFSHSEFKFVSSTAAYLDEQIWRTVEARFNTLIVNSYGLTETVMEALYCGPDDDTRRHGTIGKPVDCQARLVGDDGVDVPVGAVGELWLRGDNIMTGYFELPDATAEVLTADGWLKTGDLATAVDGYYTIAGRKKNVIIRGGINVYPEDVNSVLVSSPAVAQAATVGIPDAFLGELVVSCVAPANLPANDSLVNELMALARVELADEKVPNRVLVMDALPHGPSGKIELAKVIQAATDALGGAVEGGSARDQVLAVAGKVFGQPVDVLSESSSSDSTEGWDSLSFLELIMGLERQFDMAIAPRDVMTLKTLNDAIGLVENR